MSASTIMLLCSETLEEVSCSRLIIVIGPKGLLKTRRVAIQKNEATN